MPKLTKSIIDSIIFDLDGTLIDSKDDILDSLSKALYDCCGVEFPIGSFIIGPPLEEMLRIAAPNLSHRKISEIISSFRILYRNSGFQKTKYFDGIVPLLFELQNNNCRVFIATNKPLLLSQQILDTFANNFFHGKIIAVDSFSGKSLTKTEMLQELLSKFGLNKKKCIFIGDSPSDIEAAKLVGISSIAVGYGYFLKEALIQSSPDNFVETVNELTNLIIKQIN